MTIDWSLATNSDLGIITKISIRASMLVDIPRHHIIMDIIAAHTHGCPLDLLKFLCSNEGDFLHDIYGIDKHLSKKTGKLLHCFVPRCVKS